MSKAVIIGVESANALGRVGIILAGIARLRGIENLLSSSWSRGNGRPVIS